MDKEKQGNIVHVSDTAILVAEYRAMETSRADALFRDPYAEVLVGERGREIANKLEKGKGVWGTVVRTVVFDEMIMKKVAEDGVTAVVNLAAGLDTRPYRLNFPASFRWIEIDFPDIIAYKTEKLKGENPKCSLERIPLDLTDFFSRKKIFARINRENKKVLVVSEGLLVYLKESEVISLAEDLHEQENFQWWIADVVTPELLAGALKNIFNSFLAGDVRIHFAVRNNPDFFRRYGWSVAVEQLMSEESHRLKRESSKPWILSLLGYFIPERIKKERNKADSHFLLLKKS